MKFILFFLSWIAVSSAHADIFIEPYVGHMTAEAESQGTSGALKNDEKGMGYGLKLGYSFASYFFLAADGMLIKGEYDNTTSNTSEDLEILSYSGVAGVTLGMFRFWYANTFKVDSEMEKLDGTADEFEGKGWKAGLGVLLFRKIALNLEYIVIDYSSKNSQDIPGNGLQSLESKGYFVSLSFPSGF